MGGGVDNIDIGLTGSDNREAKKGVRRERELSQRVKVTIIKGGEGEMKTTARRPPKTRVEDDRIRQKVSGTPLPVKKYGVR